MRINQTSVQPLHANVAIPDERCREVPATVDLQGDAPCGRMTDFFLFPLHDLNSVDPSGDVRRISLDACTQLVPLIGTPKVRPAFWIDRQGDIMCARLLFLNFGDLVFEVVVSHMWLPPESFPIDSHEVSVLVIVNHGLPGFSIFSATEKQAAIRAEVIFHL